MMRNMNSFPDGAKFAFSICDDTDLSTIDNVSPIYRLLEELGMYTTKSVWPLPTSPRGRFGGASLTDPEYHKFVMQLKTSGFEIALHNVRNATCTRQEIEQGLEQFRSSIGYYPRVHVNHCNNRDNIYWGAARFSAGISRFYGIAGTFLHSRRFEGHIPGSEHFWGDLCRDRIDYVRNLVFQEINTARINPSMPYYDPGKPFVKAWFSSADGNDRTAFCKLLSEANQDRLEAEGGTCIVYTHFACGFADNGRVDRRVEELLRRLARKRGWFVPVSRLLDFLREQHGGVSIDAAELAGMERRWLADQMAIAANHVLRPRARRQYLHVKHSTSEDESNSQCRKRILHITSAHGPSDVRIFYRECRSLARAGHDVAELTTDANEDCVDGVRIIGVGPSRGRLHRMTATGIAMARVALRHRADVYHIHDPDLLPLALMLRLVRKHVIYDIHEDLPRTVLYKSYIPAVLRSALLPAVEFLENLAARCMTGLIAATPAIAQRFRPINSCTAVINNFPDMEELRLVPGRRWSERRRAVTYIGGIAEERGIRELLAAMRGLDATLEIAGWFSDPILQEELNHSPQWDNVVWHGLLDRNGIAELLGGVRAGLIVLHPEKNFLNSQPLKMFEYMAAGIPIIASNFPLWRSIIESTGAGVLVDALDPQSIADAIRHLLTHDDEAEEMGRRGRAAVEQQFNWLLEERKLLAFYQSIANSGLRPKTTPTTEAV